MSKKTGNIRNSRKTSSSKTGNTRTDAGGAGSSARTTHPGNVVVGKSAGGKGAGKDFPRSAGSSGSNRAARRSNAGAPKQGWKTWEDDDAFAGGRRGKDEIQEPVVPVSPEVVAQLRRESQQSLVRSVAVQWTVCVVVALIALLIGGVNAGLSGLLGAACVTLPNSLLAFKLLMNSLRPDGGSSTTVLVGEFVKIGAVVLLLVLVVKLGGALIVWPALLAGLIAALKSYWVMLALDSIQRKGR
ncbi:ATP synthase subunit I [Pigmentiphaga aceris]|uniref:ATP synthase subunit I n=1 Tax=Pigmentiphaga aceris TaxID=1940612 RepID=A0A5C0B324_9BURK|nr:ATP synthase subunit I [Pigmentiphaga aceris]QEI08992.1 ATP synthase subunit I [Pigmentiphaga aceris]